MDNSLYLKTNETLQHRIRLTACWLCLLSGLLTLLIPGNSAQAHPLGNFSINRYGRLELGRQMISIRYIVDMAEIPAFQELGRVDADGDGTLSESERNTYLKTTAAQLRQGLDLRIDDVGVGLALVASELSTPRGQAGLSTLRLQMLLKAEIPAGTGAGPRRLDYQDNNHKAHYGWKEIVVRPMPGITLVATDVPRKDHSDELRHYPQDLLYHPLDFHRARVTFAAGVAPASAADGQAPPLSANPPSASERLGALITAEHPTLPVMLAALMLAAALGAMHALSPGHGKAIVGAYLVGTRGTARHALILGLTVTFTHTAGVFGLGLATLFASQYLMPARLYPWLGMASGLIVAAMGASLLRQRLKGSNLYHSDRHHTHPHDHHPAHDHNHDQEHDHAFTRDGRDRQPPDSGGAPSVRNLLALGISGGLLPCPSALVVLLGAISLQRIGFGLLLILAFSLGLASVLTVVGILFIHARVVFHRIPYGKIMLKFMPLASALIITMAGLGISLQEAWRFF